MHPRVARSPLTSCSRRSLLAGTLGITGLGLVGCRGTAIQEAPPGTVAPFPGIGDPPLLGDVAWLRARQDDPAAGRLVLLDYSDLPTYRRGHIPGAVHAWWQDWIDPFSDIYGVLLSTQNVETARTDLLAELGIDDDSTVIAYDAAQNRYAARLVWILRYLGHPAAAILDGGLGAWLGAGGESSRDAADAPKAGAATIDRTREWIIPLDELRERRTDPTLVILDARTNEEATDDLNGLLRIGQVPGSVRVPWTTTLRDDAGRLRSPEELIALYRSAGVTPDKEIAVVARFGVETGQPWLVLSLLGYPTVRIFDRGWANWGRKDLDLPLEPLGRPI